MELKIWAPFYMYFPSIVLRFVSDVVKFMTWKKINFFNSKFKNAMNFDHCMMEMNIPQNNYERIELKLFECIWDYCCGCFNSKYKNAMNFDHCMMEMNIPQNNYERIELKLFDCIWECSCGCFSKYFLLRNVLK